jgi:hypothetical protein
MLPTGFPRHTIAQKAGIVKWALIPLDFSDLPGEPDFKSRIDDQMKLTSEWFDTVSEGKYKVEWVVADKWVRLPGKTSDYEILQSVNLRDAANGPKLFKDALSASSSIIIKGRLCLSPFSSKYAFNHKIKFCKTLVFFLQIKILTKHNK